MTRDEAAEIEVTSPPSSATQLRSRVLPTVASYERGDVPPRDECPSTRPCERSCRMRLDAPDASCALDVVEACGPVTLETAGVLLGVTRERIRQIEAKALRKVRMQAARTCEGGRELEQREAARVAQAPPQPRDPG